MFFFMLHKTVPYFYYFGYFVILSHWLRASGSTFPVNTSRQPVDTSGCLAASPRHPITSKHDSMKAKKSEISRFCSKFLYILLGFPIEMSCISLGYVRCR